MTDDCDLVDRTATLAQPVIEQLSGDRPDKIVISTPVWGDTFVELFCNFVVRSLLAPGNLPSLVGQFDCTYHIYTDDPERIQFRSRPFASLRNMLSVEFHSTQDFVGVDKYGTLTACYADAIARATRDRAAMVFLNADMIYSAGTFANLLARIDAGKRCVEIEGFRVLKDPVREALEATFEDAIAVSPSSLVKLALAHIHPISTSHFWEPEDDQGYMPFHTYWRAGSRGLVAKASHIYPIYLYPRNWDLGSARTIDWDLVDTAGISVDDEHIVCDSEELFAIELSAADYSIQPTFPNGCSVKQMRDFVDTYCNEGNRRRLTYTIRFRATPDEGRIDWALPLLKSLLWTKAVVNRSDVAAAILWTIEAPGRLRREHQKKRVLQRAIQRDVKSMRNPLGILTALFTITSVDSAPYRRLAEAVPSAFEKTPREWFPMIRWRHALRILNNDYERACIGPDSPLQEQDSTIITLANDKYFGTGWRKRNFSWRDLGHDGVASLFVRLTAGQHYKVRCVLAALPPEHVHRFAIEANGTPLPRQGIELTNRWEQWGIIPAELIPKQNGVVKLSARLQDAAGNGIEGASVASVQIEKFNSLQEGVLESYGLSADLYAIHCREDDHYRRLFETIPDDAAVNPPAAAAWIEKLDDILLNQILPSAKQREIVDELEFSGHITGTGWGRAARWGDQSYRWLCSTNSATIFVNLRGSEAAVLRTYIYTCPQETLPLLRVRINDEDIPEQGLVYEKDRYFLWCKIPSAARVCGIMKLSYFEAPAKDGRSDADGSDAADETRRRSNMTRSATAFTKLVVSKEHLY